jgi:hypothetical protein
MATQPAANRGNGKLIREPVENASTSEQEKYRDEISSVINERAHLMSRVGFRTNTDVKYDPISDVVLEELVQAHCSGFCNAGIWVNQIPLKVRDNPPSERNIQSSSSTPRPPRSAGAAVAASVSGCSSMVGCNV